MGRLPRGTKLVCDYTGVGRGIYDLLVDYGLAPIGVTISSGFSTNWSGNTVTVPKSTLVSTLVARLHAGELFVHESLKDWPVLRRELLNFRPEITRAGQETWNARTGAHDDLVLALAVWYLSGAGQPYSGLITFLQREMGAATSEAWVVSVDLRQSADPTAIAVLSRIERPSPADTEEPEFRQEALV